MTDEKFEPNDPIPFYEEKDILGMDKPKYQNSVKSGKVKWIFISVGGIIILLLIARLFVDTREVNYDYELNKIIWRGNFKNGYQHGKWTFYYKNGKKSAERYYNQGKLDGKEIEWYENGNVSFKCFYVKDSLDGKLISYWENGQKYSEVKMKAGKKEGDLIRWDSLGNITSHRIFKNGKTH